MNIDSRGSFSEFIKTPDRGQVSVNISKPGITKGNHWHHSKNEKFLVVGGRGVIRFRQADGGGGSGGSGTSGNGTSGNGGSGTGGSENGGSEGSCGCGSIIEYYVSGEKLEVVDIPTGYTHNIENLGDTDLITIMWANECFNPEKPDTHYLEV